MDKRYYLGLILLLTLFFGLTEKHLRAQFAPEFVKTGMIYEDNFSGGLENWVVEQTSDGTTLVTGGELEINGGGATVWFKERISGPVMIEYDAVLIQEGGPNDNCRDLNCFWMAIAPRNPADMFDGWRSNSQVRGGVFSNYHELRTYYAGIGGHKNTTSRFRRYSGHGNRPLLPEHDLDDEEFLLIPNKILHVRIISCNEIVQYFINDKLFFDFRDPQPYTHGWFGFRTVSNHVKIDNFKVFSLTPNQDNFGFPGYSPEQEKVASALSLNNGLIEFSKRKGFKNPELVKTDDGFLSEKQVFFDKQTNGIIWRLTTDPSIENNVYTDLPVWSANGNYMMFVTYRNGDPERWMMDSNGQNLKPMPEFCQGEDMFWSVKEPDVIIFSTKTEKKGKVFTNVVRGNILTGKTQLIVSAEGDLGIMQPPHPSEEYFLFGDFMDGEWTDKEHPSRAFVLDLKEKITSIEFEKLFHRLRFTKSPDARVFFNFDSPRQTFSCNRNGSNRIEVPFNGGHPDWLPGGKLLIFNAREVLPDGTKNFDLRYDAVLPDGSGLHTLYPYGGHASACNDGEYIVCDGGEGAGSVNYVNIKKPYTAQHLYFDQTSRYDHTNIWHPFHHSTHPHPNSSPDGTKVLCNTDIGGQFTDIYVAIAHLPDAPSNLKANQKGNKIKLRWEKPKRSAETKGYFIYQTDSSGMNYKRLNEIPVLENEYETGTDDLYKYFVVTAVEFSGLESSPSNESFKTGNENWKGKVRLWEEAENMNLISPVEVKMDMKNTSNGYFIHARDSEKNGSGGFVIDLPLDDSYLLWARVKKMGTLTIKNNGNEIGTLKGIEEKWIWQKSAIFKASKGKNNIEFLFSQGNECIDKILVTNDFGFTPAGKAQIDSEAPSGPTDVLAKGVSPNSIEVKWEKSNSTDLAYYNVYGSSNLQLPASTENLLASTADLKFVDYGLPLNSELNYKVTAVDYSGNESEPTQVCSAKTNYFIPSRIELKADDAILSGMEKIKSEQTMEIFYVPKKEGSTIQWEFEIYKDGDYAIWFRSQKTRNINDYYKMRVDELVVEPVKIFGLFDFVNWVQAGNIIAGTPQLFNLKKGKHSLSFELTDGNAPIGNVVITDNPSWWPINTMKSTGY